MKKQLSSLELFFLINELKPLIGGRIEKIYQDQRSLRIKVYAKTGYELIAGDGRFHLINFSKKSPETPTSFCMFLRKHIQGRKIIDIRQHEFDRVIDIVFDEYILILELFHKGNFILTDSAYKIIGALEFQKWSDRSITKNTIYEYPKAVTFRNDYQEFRNLLSLSAKNIASTLVTMGFGSTYSEEILAISGIGKDTGANSLDDKETKLLLDSINSIMRRDIKPKIVIKDGKIIDAELLTDISNFIRK